MIFARENRWNSKPNVPLPASISKASIKNQIKNSKSINRKEYIKIEQYEYAEEDLLGAGYTSKVYLGRLIENVRKQFAIKAVDRRKISKQKEHLQLLKQQMNIHPQLDHPNIVKCYKIIEKNNYYYFVLEYCPEGTLENFIKKHQKLAESTTVTIMEQIISGYKYLIEHKVLHRDLKPPNILKSGYNWKICDFGFSIMGKKNLISNINVGTPTYMAPEALERSYYSTKTDIFSIGVICYEMLFGKAPWQHKNQQILLAMMQQKITEQQLSSISNRNLIQFIMRCCEPNQRKRMSLEQFKQFCFWKEYEPKQPSLKLVQGDVDYYSKPTSKTLSTMRQFSLPASSCPSQTTNLSTVKHAKKQLTEQMLIANRIIIERELYICHIILSLMLNYTILNLKDEIQKDLYLTVLTRHSAYILRRIIHNKFNYLSLKKWEDYSLNEQYLHYSAEANQLSQKIQAVMKAEARRKSIITIRVFNKRYDDLTYDKNLSEKCIYNLKEYIHEIMTTFLKENEESERNEITRTLLYLKKYYHYLTQIPIDEEQSRVILPNSEPESRGQIILNFNDAKMSPTQIKRLKQDIYEIRL